MQAIALQIRFQAHKHDRYTCYHAIIAIIANHYRPQRDAKELDARKTLTTTLAELAVEKKG
jgi:hypothetical protein